MSIADYTGIVRVLMLMGRNISGLLSKQKHRPDIICLQETCFRYEKDHPDIAGFILANFSARNIKRGGTIHYDMNALEIIKNIKVENSSTGINTVIST
jgi:exonuclease III